MLRDLFRKGIDADVLHKTFAQFLSHEEIEKIIADEQSKMSYNEPLCTREEALQLALRKINQGCCVQYISDGLKEWLSIKISPDELDAELSDHPGLLPSYQRLKNAWYNIRKNDLKKRFQRRSTEIQCRFISIAICLLQLRSHT